MKYKNIKEEGLKNKVGADWFKHFDTTEIIGNIDFTVFPKQRSLSFGEGWGGAIPLLCAEAKTGDYDVPTMFVQLILTIGKARTFDKILPPAFLGAFDFKKIAFVPYISVQDIFYLNDFNWNVAPSNHETKEFKLIKDRVESTLKQNTSVYDYLKDEKELKHFIANNVAKATETSNIKIDKNNFYPIYLRWLDIVKPIIDVHWDELKKASILDSDFYLADLFVDDKDTQQIIDDTTIRDNLFVIFLNQGYKIAKENIKQMFDATINIRNKEAYQLFWKRYKRPPLKEFQEYIIERRDLLVPQDIRERKGAFFTPRIWVELSQKYLTDYLGKNWQEDYYVWDCAAGTGNLLTGLTNKYNIYASTLDQADVNVMHDRIEHGANLLKNHVFQFDFLNDDFFPSVGGVPEGRGGSKLPQSLQDIINDPEKRKKLVIYINPPYAEIAGKKTGVNLNAIHDKYANLLEVANRELYAQFLIRIYFEIQGCIIGEFSKLKALTGSNFKKYRESFLAELCKCFVVPANTFDNVSGSFPIGFKVWKTSVKHEFSEIQADVYDKNGNYIGNHGFYSYSNSEYFSKWVNSFKEKAENYIGWLEGVTRNDFQSQNGIILLNEKEQIAVPRGIYITITNITNSAICFAVRKCIPATWLNDRDQFLYPKDGWQSDFEFQNDCLAYTLFNNNIQSKYGVNHWIPFTESEVNAKEKFESNFMTDFIKGKIKPEQKNEGQFFTEDNDNKAREFSEEATAVFNAGRELWKYYHSFNAIKPNASLYDIKEFFQGRNEQGRMNAKSTDQKYTELIGDLRQKLNLLADKIAPKVYEYEFLKE